jgi:tetratricopeptide (TPR) repeat protein
MNSSTSCKKYFLHKLLLVLAFSCSNLYATAQKSKADSLLNLLQTEKSDTGRVKLKWQTASAVGAYNPDTAIILSQQALYLARDINYEEGESRSLGVLANTLTKIGNYPRALQLNFLKLELEEKRDNPRNMASVLMNIGVVYVLQEQYRKALEYYSKADSVTKVNDIEVMKYYIALNIGDVYNRLNISDSSFTFFTKSLELAKGLADVDLIGTSMTGLGHTYLKLESYQLSLVNYQTGIKYLIEANDDEILCEATLGLANLFEHMLVFDSAGYYANQSLIIARNGGFLSKELEAAEFLSAHYKKLRNIDSAFTFMSYVKRLNDSVNSKTKIRESAVISSDEQLRQMELAENNRKAKEERFQQLQLLLIAIFIPFFFLLTVLLSKAKIQLKVIRALGVLSLLFLFEYLTLLLHPRVAALTHHTPLYEILIFVGIAALLIPLHHRLEHWLIHKLIHSRHKKRAEKEISESVE